MATTETKIPLFDTSFGPEEEEAVLRVLRSGWLTMGPEVEALEGDLCSATGARHAVAVSNGTAALLLACNVLGIDQNAEVLCPTLTFAATASAPRALGARIRLCESCSDDDLTVDPDSLRAQRSERARAVMVMHYAGFPCNMNEILPWAKQHELAVIEDCAHALFSRYHGQTLGLLGDIGCFSFYSNKNATCGEGGALITNDDQIAMKLRQRRSHGMTAPAWNRHLGQEFTYDIVHPGLNYRLDEMRAALLRVQLGKLPALLQRRQELFRHYQARLKGTPVQAPFQGDRFSIADTGVHIMPVLLPKGSDRPAIMQQLRQLGIQTSIHYPPVHRLAAYQPQPALPRTDAIANRLLTLPLYPQMKDSDVDLVTGAVLNGLAPCTESKDFPHESLLT